MADAGFSEEQLAKLRAREKHARDIAEQDRARAERYRPAHRRGAPISAGETTFLASLAGIFAANGVQPGQRPTFDERMRPPSMSPQQRGLLLRRRLYRDVPHENRERMFDAHGNRLPPRDTKAMRGARRWWERRMRKAVLLCGTPGVGKTYAANWLALEHLDANPLDRVCWLHATQLVGAVLFPGKDAKVPELSRFVVVDDVGREQHSPETFAEALAQLVEMGEVRQIVLTSNMIAQDFRGRYDGPEAEPGVPGRLSSRLNGYVTTVECVGEDLRGTAGGF